MKSFFMLVILIQSLSVFANDSAEDCLQAKEPTNCLFPRNKVLAEGHVFSIIEVLTPKNESKKKYVKINNDGKFGASLKLQNEVQKLPACFRAKSALVCQGDFVIAADGKVGRVYELAYNENQLSGEAMIEFRGTSTWKTAVHIYKGTPENPEVLNLNTLIGSVECIGNTCEGDPIKSEDGNRVIGYIKGLFVNGQALVDQGKAFELIPLAKIPGNSCTTRNICEQTRKKPNQLGTTAEYQAWAKRVSR